MSLAEFRLGKRHPTCGGGVSTALEALANGKFVGSYEGVPMVPRHETMFSPKKGLNMTLASADNM